jgi:hypothetical protein
VRVDPRRAALRRDQLIAPADARRSNGDEVARLIPADGAARNTGASTVSQRTRLPGKQRSILEALELPEPPRYYQFEPLND